MTIAARVLYPVFLERAKTQDTSLEVYNGVNPAAITAATYTLYKEDGAKAVDAQSATISGGTVSYEVQASDVPATDAYSRRWREEWAVTVAGTVYTLRRDAHVVPLRLYPVVTNTDVLRKHTELQHHYPESRESWQHAIDEAWTEIVGRLVTSGKNPGAIISPWSLRAPHLMLTLCNAFTEASIYDNSGRFTALADHYCERFEELWASLSFEYDIDDDGDADVKDSPQGPILAHAGPSSAYWWPGRRRW